MSMMFAQRLIYVTYLVIVPILNVFKISITLPIDLPVKFVPFAGITIQIVTRSDFPGCLSLFLPFPFLSTKRLP